jgi:hypothetical protein
MASGNYVATSGLSQPATGNYNATPYLLKYCYFMTLYVLLASLALYSVVNIVLTALGTSGL